MRRARGRHSYVWGKHYALRRRERPRDRMDDVPCTRAAVRIGGRGTLTAVVEPATLLDHARGRHQVLVAVEPHLLQRAAVAPGQALGGGLDHEKEAGVGGELAAVHDAEDLAGGGEGFHRRARTERRAKRNKDLSLVSEIGYIVFEIGHRYASPRRPVLEDRRSPLQGLHQDR